MTNKAGAFLERGTSWMTGSPRAPASLGLLRSTIGLVSFVYYVSAASDRHFLFGPDGLFGRDLLAKELDRTGSWSLFAVFGDGSIFDGLYFVGTLTSTAVLLGLGGRAVLALHWVLLWSLYAANPTLMDGGDNLVVLLIPFLMLTRCFDRIRVTRPRFPAPHCAVANAANNLGVLLIASQACIVYLLAGLYKVQGELWQDGTALYYVLRIPEFYLPGVTPLLFHLGWVLVAAAYATVLTSVFFTPLVFFRAGRPWAVASMLLFHIAIAVLMGLTSFALVMMAMDLIFINDHADKVRSWFVREVQMCLSKLRGSRRGGADVAR
ncbi:HTTM domain-containing protein [Curtobacterium sp. RRHDQ10]|uniref:HTTM domain-containing protein n=1 Tax=Curtobacterium phyllosphaerae TaxID=3413379 RepID=UPI003BF215F6